jgi:hypothetical protein
MEFATPRGPDERAAEGPPMKRMRVRPEPVRRSLLVALAAVRTEEVAAAPTPTHSRLTWYVRTAPTHPAVSVELTSADVALQV